MQPSPTQVTLELRPQARYDIIDLNKEIDKNYGDILNRFSKALYCSFHTTAGFLEEELSTKLKDDMDTVDPFINAFKVLFPPNADYRHDQLQLRAELSDEQRKVEPKNADSHLVFIGAGMKNCVTYPNKPKHPIYFIDLDGMNGSESRRRRATVLGFNDEKSVYKAKVPFPVSKHPVDSIKMDDPANEFLQQLNCLVQKMDIQHGKVEIELCEEEQGAGLTVNEYETLLMKHDLAEVLRNPLKYMAMQGKHALKQPQLIPEKTINYAKYDLVHVFNELMDVLGVSETVIEKMLSAFLRWPAEHFLSMKRHVSLLISDEGNSKGEIIFGKYQSPILVQWKSAKAETRYLNVTLSKFS